MNLGVIPNFSNLPNAPNASNASNASNAPKSICAVTTFRVSTTLPFVPFCHTFFGVKCRFWQKICKISLKIGLAGGLLC